ncbi:regucalcin [Leptinotarsa decemlineata]|uniref:regucalcin n=1 Tax=Leptinotarsa decemlineata TaxID=7539 RepID=UPI003D30715A
MFFGSLCVMLVLTAVEGSDFDKPAVYQLTEPMDHAEGPTWDARKNILYFVNIHAGEVLAYHYDTKILRKMHLNGEVTPVIPSRKNPNLLLVGLNRSVVAVEWDGKKKLGDQVILSTISQQFPKSRFNDGKADKQGRVWWGTIGPEADGVVTPNQGVFYKFTRDNLDNPTVIRSPVTNSNGLAWNKANDKLYYIDTPTSKVVEFDYDDKTGTVSDKNRTAFDLTNYPNIAGHPDGMTIDDEDNLYICLYGGGSVLKVNPVAGKILQVIALPARDVTSAMWGGPNFDILFVTTSSHSLTPLEKRQFPAAGSLFAIENLKAKGLPVFTANIIDEIPKKLNLLDNFFPSDTFTPKKNVYERDTELSFWESVMGALRSFF